MSSSKEKNRSSLLRGIASVLNTCGNAVVVTFDTGAKLTGSIGGAIMKLPGLGSRKKGGSGKATVYQREFEKILENIKEYEQKIKALYYEIGKTSARLTETEGDNAQIGDSGTVKELLEKIHNYENSVKKLRGRIAGLEEERVAEEARQTEEESYRRATLMAGRARKGKKPGNMQKVTTDINNAIKEALIHGNFDTASDRAVFNNVASDLMDKEPEIQMLAAAELGKIKNPAAVPVLHAAINMAEGHLATEIINSLISLADPSSIAVLQQTARDTNARVRVTSLRGLYKLSPDDKEVRRLINDSLSDINPEVRKTAATLLGWLDDNKAVPALIQCLTDEDERVRKAVVSALANIRDTASMLPIIRQLQDDSAEVRQKALDAIQIISGHEVSFDLSSKGDELLQSIESIKKWWQEVRASGNSKPFVPGAQDGQKTAKPLPAEKISTKKSIKKTARAEELSPELQDEAETVEAVAPTIEISEETPRAEAESPAKEKSEETGEGSTQADGAETETETVPADPKEVSAKEENSEKDAEKNTAKDEAV